MHGLSGTLKTFAWIFIVGGLVAGIYFSQYTYYPKSILNSDFAKELLGTPTQENKYDFKIMIPYIFTGFFSGLLLIGVSEIINLQTKLLHLSNPNQNLLEDSQKSND